MFLIDTLLRSLAYGRLRLKLLDIALQLFQPNLSGGITPPVERRAKMARCIARRGYLSNTIRFRQATT